MDLTVQIGKKLLSNPVGVASGTFGYGSEFEKLIDLSLLGALYTKAVTLDPRPGNDIPRIIETPSGLLNSIFVVLCLEQFRSSRSALWPTLLAGGALKIAWETAFGPLATSSSDWPPFVGAHFAGFMTGLVLHFINQFRRMRRSWYFPWASCPLIP